MRVDDLGIAVAVGETHDRVASLPPGSLYGVAVIAGIGLSAFFWIKRARQDSHLMAVFVAALVGAFLGAKVGYLLVEGWHDWGQPDRWVRLATGKTVLGALLGGFLSVEIVKKLLAYDHVTGDLFATVVPASIALGRVGCWHAGCCLGRVCEPQAWTLTDAQGISRWPAVPLELAFNLVAFAVFWVLRRRQVWVGQHFHLYLMTYGAFRVWHEHFRDTPKMESGWTGYQIEAACVLAAGIFGFWNRWRGSLNQK